MKRRFMLLYKCYREKKGLERGDDSNSDGVQDYDREDAAMIAKIRMMVAAKPIDYDSIGVKKQDSQANHISDLESIKEDDEESDDFGSKTKTVNTKEQCEEFVQEKVEDTVVKDFLTDYLRKMMLIREFLTEVALRRRFKKKQRALIKMQSFFRMMIAKKKLRKLKTAGAEIERGRLMDIYCRHRKDKKLLNDSALKIQTIIHKKIVKRKEAKELREKMKALPFVCRSSFLKMQLLKANTAALKMGVKQTIYRKD